MCSEKHLAPCKAHGNFWARAFPQILWSLKALTFYFLRVHKELMAVISHYCTLGWVQAHKLHQNPTYLFFQIRQNPTPAIGAGLGELDISSTEPSLWSWDNHLETPGKLSDTARKSVKSQQTPGLRQQSHGITECFGLGGTLKHLHSLPRAGTPSPGSSGVPTCNENNTSPWELLLNPDTVMWYQFILILQFKPRSAISAWDNSGYLQWSVLQFWCFGVPWLPHKKHQHTLTTTRASPLGFLTHWGKNKWKIRFRDQLYLQKQTQHPFTVAISQNNPYTWLLSPPLWEAHPERWSYTSTFLADKGAPCTQLPRNSWCAPK